MLTSTRSILAAHHVRKVPVQASPCRFSMYASSFHTLEAVAAHLPFAVDDVEQVNDTSARWHADGTEEAKRLLDIWTYCYIRRYFLHKFIQTSRYEASDLEQVVELSYRKVESHLHQLQDPERYAQWVSVICRRTYLNFLRSRRAMVSVDDAYGPTLRADDPAAYHDAGQTLHALHRAIDRLPEYLQESARMRLLEDLSYEDMHAATGKPLPTLRTYVNKAVKRLRSDTLLRALLNKPPTEEMV